MIDSKKYWENRYHTGGDSGRGSYGDFKKFKTRIINQILDEYNINEVYDLGCGDGSQIEHINIHNMKYVGFDVSETAINICKKKYPNLIFDNILNIKNYNPVQLTMSNDVIYHLIEDSVYDIYMENLLNKTNKYVLIFSTNFNQKYGNTHVKHRNFDDKLLSEFTLLKKIKNEIPGGIADFYLYEINNNKNYE